MNIVEEAQLQENIYESQFGKRTTDDIYESEFSLPTKKLNSVKIKYTPVTKKTFETDERSISFVVEINGARAKGFWTPTRRYTAQGVDVNTLYPDDGNYGRSNGVGIDIFEGGGSYRTYELSTGALKPNEK